MDLADDYKQRQKEWRDISITQLSNANNILLTFSSAFLAICFEKKKLQDLHIATRETLDWTMILYLFYLFLICFSIFCGLCLLITRLYDFRVSRHILFTRLRYTKKHKGNPLPNTENDNSLARHPLTLVYHILFRTLPFMSKHDIESKLEINEIHKKFKILKTLSTKLGQSTWIFFKYQFCSFFICIFIYIIYTLMN